MKSTYQIVRTDAMQDILDTLTECHAFLDNYVDVEDGNYGTPAPNRAMSLQSRVTEAIANLQEKK